MAVGSGEVADDAGELEDARVDRRNVKLDEEQEERYRLGDGALVR